MHKYWLVKFRNVFAYFALALALASCDETGCIEADELNNKSVKVNSNPVSDGVSGTYNHANGGQVAQWHETGLLTSTEDFIIMVSGKWQPWRVAAGAPLERCKICSKRRNLPTENCICGKNETSIPEKSEGIGNVAADCSGADQNDPSKCTCTKNNGLKTDYGVFHFPLNYYDKKNHAVRLPDEQTGPCFYDRGLGLYLGIFGRSGSQLPLRAYHLFSEEEVCSIKRNPQGQCIDENGIDRTRYVFRSANRKPLVKDDKAGNDGLDIDPGDDEYHKPNEYIKLIIYDSYYSDNLGEYKVEFVKGVVDDDAIGLLEFLVAIVEDQMLGEFNEEGVREGGIVEFMYNAITKDYNFIGIFQMMLVLYVAFFGLSSLFGLVELNKKEIYGRIAKVGLIIFLINPDSWFFYNQLVIGFFKDSMGTIIDIVSNISDLQFDEETNPIVLAQQASASPDSTASRFAYIDGMIRMLFSSTVTKKIWGLFFYRIYGLILIVVIYALIAYFIYAMLIAAIAYAVTLMKLLFGLALGPFFIALGLFKQTGEMTKKWIGFLGARSIEIIILFLLLYIFVTLIDKKFNEILSFQVCAMRFNVGFFSFGILIAESTRNFVDWLSMMAVLGIYIFMTDIVMMQVPTLSGALVSIGGQGNATAGGASFAASGFKMAKGMAGEAFDAGKKAGGFVASEVGGQGFRAGRNVLRATGVSKAIDSAFNKIPVRGLRSRLRDNIIDQKIKQGEQHARKKGLSREKDGARFDQEVRKYALGKIGDGKKTEQGLYSWKRSNRKKAALYDMTNENILKRLDKKLVKDPLRNYLKDQAKKLKKLESDQIPLGKEMSRQLQSDARNWAEKNLFGGPQAIEGHLGNMKNFIKKEGELTTKQAAKRFGKDENLQNKYLHHLKDQQFDKKAGKNARKITELGGKINELKKKPSMTPAQAARLSNYEKKRDDLLQKSTKDAGKMRKRERRFTAALEDEKSKWYKPSLNKVGKYTFGGAVEARQTRGLTERANRDYLSKGGYEKEKANLNKHYDDKVKRAETDMQKRKFEAKRKEKIAELDEKRRFFKAAMIERARNKALADKRGGDLEKLRKSANDEVKRLKEEHRKRAEELIGNQNWKEIAERNGGLKAYSDGMVDIDGKTLLEAQAYADALRNDETRDQAGFGADSPMVELERQQAQLEEETRLFNEEMEQREKELAEGKEISALPTEPDIEFGATLEDALGLQASDIGVTAGDIRLGAASDDGAQIDHAMLHACEMSKTQANSRYKMKNFEKKLLEHEVSQMANDDPQKAAKQSQIADLDHEVKKLELECQDLESQVASLKQGY